MNSQKATTLNRVLLTTSEKFAKISYSQVLMTSKNYFLLATAFFEEINVEKDRVLGIFIEKYWPRQILPNHLTAARISIGMVLFIELFFFANDRRAMVISFFLIGILTDFLDGPVARTLHEETKIREVLDSLADRILIIPIAMYSLFGLHYWLVLWIVIFEAINTLVSIHPSDEHPLVPSNIFAKMKMFLQSIVFL